MMQRDLGLNLDSRLEGLPTTLLTLTVQVVCYTKPVQRAGISDENFEVMDEPHVNNHLSPGSFIRSERCFILFTLVTVEPLVTKPKTALPLLVRTCSVTAFSSEFVILHTVMVLCPSIFGINYLSKEALKAKPHKHL